MVLLSKLVIGAALAFESVTAVPNTQITTQLRREPQTTRLEQREPQVPTKVRREPQTTRLEQREPQIATRI